MDEKKVTEAKDVNCDMHYEVKKGDTLWLISQKYNVPVDKLVKINNIKNPDAISVGQIIKLHENVVELKEEELSNVAGGRDKYYEVKPGDTLWAISRRYGVSVDKLARLNAIKNPDVLRVGQVLKLY